MEHHDLTSKFIESESPTTREHYTSPSCATRENSPGEGELAAKAAATKPGISSLVMQTLAVRNWNVGDLGAYVK